MTADDRRRAKRYRAHLQVRLEHEGQEENPRHIEDISTSGLFIPTDNPLPHLSPVKIRLYLPDSGEEGFLLEGEVVRVVKPAAAKAKNLVSGMGIQFKNVSVEAEAALARFVKEVSALLETGSVQRSASSPALSASVIDRRSEPRLRTRLKLRFKDKAALQNEYLKNISQGGVFIRTQRRFLRGEDLMVILQHPVSKEEFELRGTVVNVIDEKRIKEDPALVRGVGIRFQEMGKKTLLELQDFIDEILALEVNAEEEAAEIGENPEAFLEK